MKKIIFLLLAFFVMQPIVQAGITFKNCTKSSIGVMLYAEEESSIYRFYVDRTGRHFRSASIESEKAHTFYFAELAHGFTLFIEEYEHGFRVDMLPGTFSKDNMQYNVSFNYRRKVVTLTEICADGSAVSSSAASSKNIRHFSVTPIIKQQRVAQADAPEPRCQASPFISAKLLQILAQESVEREYQVELAIQQRAEQEARSRLEYAQRKFEKKILKQEDDRRQLQHQVCGCKRCC
ncbi:hypothetical protein K2X40_01365 [Candidatus Babeliales bacterium]|nr:hypothetical protein [Candidatus Babeliales bacterium]